MRGRTRVLWVLGTALLGLVPFLQSAWAIDGFVHKTFEVAGFLLMLVCIGGRTWCSAFIGGRKNYELVTSGPYSVVRNPLYLFSFAGTVGVGLLTGTVTFPILALAFVFAVHHVAVVREETVLAEGYGQIYTDYASRTPRWIPRLPLWEQPDIISVRPRFLYRTLRDIWWILALFPAFELVDLLQADGILPVMLHLY